MTISRIRTVIFEWTPHPLKDDSRYTSSVIGNKLYADFAAADKCLENKVSAARLAIWYRSESVTEWCRGMDRDEPA